ncbi:hypothetical protein Rhe02_38200 [Rhizocola hellebori]|uniref:Uncharacterized protein n=1 Tax=Rhizocola hellebori TaxID=1392758 RepID=A0A8J3Q9P5_9ACTN|nr:hypothetical protein [Rhizocola hellebori]GIH05753.1 hypothetical protein Rhe02_38200 [Rhizocola hellebori]
MRISFVSRGHGFGHAARDLRIINAIRRLRPDAQISLASAGSGMAYYRSRGVDAEDLGFDDAVDSDYDAGWRVWRFLYQSMPADLVVSDEFLTVPSFCRRVLAIPNVLLTDWFFAELGQPELDVIMDDAVEIVVPDFPQAHPVPLGTTAPVWYCGPIVDNFAAQRDAARAELGLSDDALVLLVAAGGRPDRKAALEIQLQALRAFTAYAGDSDQLLLLADPPPLRKPAPTTPNIRWVGRTDRPDLYYRAADVVLADALGFTGCELVSNGVPVIAAVNPDPGRTIRAGFHERLELLESTGLLMRCTPSDDPSTLWAMAQKLRGAADATHPLRAAWGDADEVAARILSHAGGVRP